MNGHGEGADPDGFPQTGHKAAGQDMTDGRAGFELVSRRRSGLGAVLVLPLLAAACGMTGPATRDNDLGPVFEAIYVVAMPAGLAEELAEGCPELNYDKARYEAELDAVVASLQEQGFTDEQIKAEVAQVNEGALGRGARADEAAYIEQNGIVFAEPETVCRAGQTEIAEGSAIGAFLNEG